MSILFCEYGPWFQWHKMKSTNKEKRDKKCRLSESYFVLTAQKKFPSKEKKRKLWFYQGRGSVLKHYHFTSDNQTLQSISGKMERHWVFQS